jgi:circadian clock protein KaiB
VHSLVPEAAPRPQAFKGIAVFTPGGDLVYCRDEHKRAQWHISLCAALQEHLELPEPPHFLVPCFTATVDRWIEPKSLTMHTVAEGYPFVLRYQALLNAVFGLGNLEWQLISAAGEACSPSMLETHRAKFPQLWENHDLVLDASVLPKREGAIASLSAPTPDESGPILRLFVSGHSAITEQILKTLQGVLETSRHRPYTLKVIDVSKHPEQAEADQISATPTLVRVWPSPARRLVGDLRNPRAILGLLNEP